APGTLVWVEAMDGGNPKEKARYRDRVVTLSAPFQGEPKEVVKVEQRYRGMQFLEGGTTALIEDYDRNKRWLRTFVVDAKNGDAQPKLLFGRNVQDAYKDPGLPVTRALAGGRAAVEQAGDTIFLAGAGSTPEGDHPFVDKLDWKTG